VSFLLDTCVISELTKPEPDESVLGWFSLRAEDELYLSVMTLAELEKGLAKLPPSRKRKRLTDWVRGDLMRRFEGRLLALDLLVARAWGEMVGMSEKSGQPLPVIDSLIAATATAHGMQLVSRNEEDFKRCGVICENPWLQR
jgi:toxin FitB